MGHKRMTDRCRRADRLQSPAPPPEVLEAVGKMREMGVRVFAMTNPEGKIGQAVGAENCVMMASDHGAGGCEKGYYLADCFGLRLLNRQLLPQVRPVHRADEGRLEGHARHPQALRAARRGARQEVRAGRLHHVHRLGRAVGRDRPVLHVLLEEMQWKRIRHITSHDFFHGTLELLEPGVPVFLFMGEDESAPSTSASAPSSPAA